jgi:nucleotide-binding universal stress UspA family protein
MKIMVAYDGSLQAKAALLEGIRRVKANGGEVVAMHVFDVAPFIDYEAGPYAVEMARQETERTIAEAKRIMRKQGEGVSMCMYSAEGDPADVLIATARELKADTLFCPPRFRSALGFRRSAGMQDVQALSGSRYSAYALK